ncbi:dephospho-CoA kinase [Rouxiella badensis]|uniref:dephospho-CoA kinase n=1 Tax=Rouxiella badensis TaxID=1646377 RepID=UPI001787845F|nr:dephospho-CoA kinase [Rouxiella badensis]MCC3746897.1 dephospho-CoA kinase [Rouxiella badensis]QOI57621.1 dephospho-CoA kinase [Rouxiella badensis subsp. acadiensis]
MSYIVALTGGIGSGKSTVANAFARLGITLVDADVIARRVVEPETPALLALAERFGKQVIQENSSLNRPRLREIIFSNADDKQWVNQLLHPIIQAETQRLIQAASSPYVLWVVPLLVENGLQARANRVLVVDVSEEIQLARTVSRDGVSLQQAKSIIAAQASRQQRLACADDIIDNNGGPETIEPRVASLHSRYLDLAASATRQDIDKNE